MSKPIRVFYSTVTERFYATHHYEIKSGKVEVTGEKFDVTDDIGAGIAQFGLGGPFTPEQNV